MGCFCFLLGRFDLWHLVRKFWYFNEKYEIFNNYKPAYFSGKFSWHSSSSNLTCLKDTKPETPRFHSRKENVLQDRSKVKNDTDAFDISHQEDEIWSSERHSIGYVCNLINIENIICNTHFWDVVPLVSFPSTQLVGHGTILLSGKQECWPNKNFALTIC